MHVDENSYFWSAKKVTDSTSTDLESFVTLVGGVSSGDEALSAAELAERYKSRSSEFARAVDQMAADKEQSMVPLINSDVVKHAMREGAKEQTRVLLGDDADQDKPLIEGGLIPSKDGLSWALPG
jgi:FAD-dependent halogenase